MRPYDLAWAPATVRSGNHPTTPHLTRHAYRDQGVQGYWIKAYRNLTSVRVAPATRVKPD